LLLVFYRLSGPLVDAIERSSALVSRALGLYGAHRGGHSADELKLVVSASRGAGHLPPPLEDILHRALDVGGLTVREIMVPRNEIVSIPVEATLDQALRTMITEQHSRLPVYDGKPEHIVGVLFYKDLLPVWVDRRAAIAAGRRPPEFRVRELMRAHKVVPETKPLVQILEEFRQGPHMALVVDEFGTIAGLVTVEDVLEQIVGEIADEYDVHPRPLDRRSPVVELDGATNIRDLETQHGIEIPSGAGFETLAGFLLQQLGYIPKSGDAVEHGARRFTVLEMQRNRIARVLVERL
ncbi:MAG: hemolysin family protein, partial [bacterium]